ncbi:hypothetical protein DFH27DRAFT_612139 [Peziza echinospora]|nr:hypothetical protein DFH27DRAFT_612139 [Peziza echinospora]
MASADDYRVPSSGGRLKLKLKGDTPAAAGGAEKKKKKKKGKRKAVDDDDAKHDNISTVTKPDSDRGSGEDREEEEGEGAGKEVEVEIVEKTKKSKDKDKEKEDRYYGKTDAERRFEERKRRRLDERLQKDGVKSHKEKVEEFNKYLAGLSEHHDMPRIGPG